MTKTLLSLCAALMLLPATSFAAPAGETVNDEGARVVDNGEVRELIFDDGDTIDGETLSPEGMPVSANRRKELGNMIKVRTQFIPHLIALSSDI